MDKMIDALLEMAKPRPGWTGGFTTQQAEGAMPNGTVIVKCDQDSDSDLTKLGTKGTVLGSINSPHLGMCYFIEWHDKPKVAVAVVAWKVQAAG